MLDLSSKILQGGIYVGHGRIIIHLSELIEGSGISKNRFSHLAAMERTQINNYCKNNVAHRRAAGICPGGAKDLKQTVKKASLQEGGGTAKP